jgi:hypothetical protein
MESSDCWMGDHRLKEELHMIQVRKMMVTIAWIHLSFTSSKFFKNKNLLIRPTTGCPLLTLTLVIERNMILNTNAWKTLTYSLI